METFLITLGILAYIAAGTVLSRLWVTWHLAGEVPLAEDRRDDDGDPVFERPRTRLKYLRDPLTPETPGELYLAALVHLFLWPAFAALYGVRAALRWLYISPADKVAQVAREHAEQRAATIDHWAKLSTSDDEWVRKQAVEVLKILGASEAIKPGPLVFTGTAEEIDQRARELQSAIDAQRKAGPHYGEAGAR